MQSRETRFWLRFDAGARRGERIPLAPGVVRLGRRSDNTVVVADASVSGRHAELRVEEERVVLTDLGSTNGTKVGGQKVTSVELAHGASFQLGSVRFSLLDGRLSDESGEALELARGGEVAPGGVFIEGLEPERAPPAPSDELGRVAVERVARARSRSKLGWLFAPVLLALLGIVAWRFWPPGVWPRSFRSAASLELPDVPGNALADPSFEGEAFDWESAEAAPQAFFRDGAFAKSGRFGLGATLAEGEWAFARSSPIDIRPGRRLAARASVRTDAGALARLGVELLASDARAFPMIVWKEAVAGDDSFVESEHVLDTWSGYDRGRIVLAALAGHAGGSVALDDVSLVLADDPRGPDTTFNEFELFISGSAAIVVRSGVALLGPFEFGTWGENGLTGSPEATWSARATANGLALEAGGVSEDAWCYVRLGGGGAGAGGLRIATTGPDGYQAHSSEFEREEAQGILLGEGLDLVKIALERPVLVRGSAEEGAAPTLALALGDLGRLELVLSFREERAEAALLEKAAREAEAKKDYGAALTAWSELLNRVPFEARLVEVATSERARALQQGLEDLSRLRTAFDRARFFELADLYREVRASAEALASSYRGSEVETEARGLIREIDLALESLVAGERSEGSRLLAGVLSTLDPARSPELYSHVRAVLEGFPQAGEDR